MILYNLVIEIEQWSQTVLKSENNFVDIKMSTKSFSDYNTVCDHCSLSNTRSYKINFKKKIKIEFPNTEDRQEL